MLQGIKISVEQKPPPSYSLIDYGFKELCHPSIKDMLRMKLSHPYFQGRIDICCWSWWIIIMAATK